MATAAGMTAMSIARPGNRQESSGKPPDFGEVYRTHFRPLYAFVAYRVGNRQTAEDITSQVFERALRSYSVYDPQRASVSTWLYIIARNAVFDHFRRRERHDISGLDEQAAVSSDDDPVSELEANERQRVLADALQSLDDREQELLALKFGAGMNNREIAGVMEIGESNVGTILYRSLKKLKTKLEGGIDND